MKKFNKKTLKIGSFTLISTAIVLAVLIFLNLIAAKLPSSVMQIDTTKQKIFELHSETISMLDSVSEKVNIYMILEPDGDTDTTAQVESLIMRYKTASNKISYEKIDPVARPSFAEKYTDETLNNGSVIVESEGRSRIIKPSEWFMYETAAGNMDIETYYTYAQYGYVNGSDPLMFFGERNITSAIDYVTAKDAPKAYTLSGHGEESVSETYLSYVKDQNIDVETLSLQTGDGKIPADCDMLIINVPSKDISEAESTAITDYFNAGGNVLLSTYNGSFSKTAMPNLEKTAEAMGLSSVDGCIIEGDTNYYFSGTNQFYLVPVAEDNDNAALLVPEKYPCITPLSHGIEAVEGTGAKVSGLLRTSSSAFIKSIEDISNNNITRADGDKTGPFWTAAMSALETESGNSSFVWVSSPYFMTDTSYDTGGNSSFFISIINYMCEKETKTALLGVNVSVEPLNITSASTVSNWHTVLVWVVPVLVLGVGLAVWIIRRKK